MVLLNQRIDESVDVSRLCTSIINDMSSLFLSRYFNQDIVSWDVGDVTDMSAMCNNASSFNQDLALWYVINILCEPDNFAPDSIHQIKYYPIWGTCHNPLEPIFYVYKPFLIWI